MTRIASTRNYGIDLLRLLSMIGVVLLHIFSKGHLLWDPRLVPFSPSYATVWFFNYACFASVNCFALTSGYVGAQKTTTRYAGLAYLYLQVWFYSVIISASFWLSGLEEFSLKALIKSALPVTFDSYWYVNAYICLFFLMPLLNLALQRLSEKNLLVSLGGLFFCFSILPLLARKDLFHSAQGYSVIWLVLMYLAGGALARFSQRRSFSSLGLLGLYICCVGLGLVSQLWNEFLQAQQLERYGINLLSYDAPTTVLAAVALVLIFAQLPLRPGTKRLVAWVTPLYFSIYLIHLHPFVAKHFLQDQLGFFLDYPLPITLLLTLGTALGISLLCMGIDYIRLQVFKGLQVAKLLQKCENYFRQAR